MGIKSILLAATALVLSTSANAVVIEFDDITKTATAPITDGYDGFNWGGINVGGGTPPWWPGSGFENGRVSGKYVAWQSGVLQSAISLSGGGVFDFNGAYFTAAWNTGLNITVDGLLNNSLIYSSISSFNTDAPTWFNLNFSGIDKLLISAIGGVNAGLGGAGVFWAMDNFTYNEEIPAVPVPAAVWLFGSGLIGLIGIARRKKA